MKIRIQRAVPSRADLVLAFVVDGERPDAGKGLAAAVAAAKATGDLKLSFRNVSLFHPRGSVPRLGFIGLGKGKELSTERLRRAAAVAQATAEDCGIDRFVLVVGQQALGKTDAAAAGSALAEGLLLGAYRYEPPKKDKSKPRKGQDCTVVFLGSDTAAFARGFALGEIAARATVFARDLENQPSNVCTPAALASAAKSLAGGGIRVKVLERRDMQRLGMGSLLGVAQGSAKPPKLLVLEYGKGKDTVCVVGKGLTFDTGGISIKPAAKMDEMRYDMCGAGAVLGLFHALRHGALAGAARNTRIVGVVAAAENMPGPAAQNPGDVVRAMDGHTIEVLNTDAEGRLVLADAIAYARKFHQPKQLVDLATLTGAVVVALGHEVAGIMGNDQKLIDALIAAGKQADEPLWQLPLWDVHKEQMKSKFADLQNINGPQHGNGSIAGGAFLGYFAGDTPWAHLDIAGTAYGGNSKDYYKAGAAGTAVRTLLRWLLGRR
ncbi:MAG TPA: leucyl aminopeptidase [Planctomycetota bacterium]|nr:leucyl aminopeptidase [Planctomycetota bacterium]